MHTAVVRGATLGPALRRYLGEESPKDVAVLIQPQVAAVRLGVLQLAPDGEVLLEVDRRYEIDNMEGIDVHVTPEGETVLTMVSDDNFSMIQRTLLLQFTLVDP